MTRPNTDELADTINGVVEVRAAVMLISRRLSAVGDMDAPDDNEIMSLSRVADLCVRSLNNVAEMLELVEIEVKRVV